MAESHNKSLENQLEWLGLLLVLGSIPFLSAIGIIFYQSFMWMKSGEWPSITIDMAVNKFFPYSSFNEWLINPQSWYGLHKIVSNESLSPFLFSLSIFYFVLVMYICVLIDSFEKKHKRRRDDESSTPCPYCGKPLRTPKAKQCRHCGRDWHD